MNTPLELSAETRALLLLRLVPGLGPRLTAALIKRFGSATAVLQAKTAELQEIPHISARLAGAIRAALDRGDLAAELQALEAHRVGLVVRGASDYPAGLVEIADAPFLLYVRGTLVPADARAVAIVGSRGCTAYGRRVAEKLATGLVHAGFTVVSGLARGIDGVAHQAALQAGGRTLAVLAGGLSKIYPPEHDGLARDIEASGALLTEVAMRMEPMAGMFHARNRLISGLSLGVVIVEAAQRSGALITASHAAEQGRHVFAIPGPIDAVASAGTHELIRKGATLIRGVEDILEELHDQPAAASSPNPEPPEPPPNLDPTQLRLWEFLAGEPRHMDEMAQQLQMPIAQVSSNLLLMEMKRIIRRLPGNRFERC